MNRNLSEARRRSLWKSPALVAVSFVTILLVASYFVDDWNWPPMAFIVVGGIIFSLGFIYEVVTRNRDAMAYRAAVGISFTAGFMTMWGNFVQMADVNPAAAMYFAVPIVGIIGAALARLRPEAMARALFVTALAQGLVLAVVLMLLITGNSRNVLWTLPVLRGFGGNVVCGLMFAGSALLFRKAAREELAPDAV